MGKASAAPQADATTVRPAIGIEVARRATPAAEPTPAGVTVGATLVDRTAGLAPEGETTERTAVEERTAAAQIEVVTETSLIGCGRLNCHAQPFPWVRSCQSAATEGWHYCGSP